MPDHTRQPVPRRAARAFAAPAFAALAIAALGLAPACDGKKSAPKGAKPPAETVTALDVRARPLPEYAFAEGLRGQYPEVSSFLVQFLETCLADDYNGYRAMVSRRFEPESRERFEAIYHAIQSVRVEKIEQVQSDRLSALPPPVYRVVSDIKLDPQRAVAMRGPNRKIAILVFREQGDWRMVTAPPQFQPKAAPASQPAEPASQPTSQPSYPWDETGDG